MVAIEAVKPLGLFSIVIMWGMVSYLLQKWPHGVEASISKHAAAGKKSFVLMALMQSFCLPLFLVFGIFWLRPTFALPYTSMVFLALAVFGIVMAAWVPARGKSTVHDYLAYSGSFFLIPVTFALAQSGLVSSFARGVSLLATAFMLYCLYLFFNSPAARKKHLIYQAAYFAIFHLAVLSAVYIR